MHASISKSKRPLVVLGALALSLALLAAPGRYVYAQDRAPDNTANNKDQTQPTADQQKQGRSDIDITQQIRKSIHDDNSLSTYGHNVKVVTDHGRVTLRGPVRSEDEKNNLQAKAESVVGPGNVDNQLEVKAEK